MTVDASGSADEWDARTGRHLSSLPGTGIAEAVGYSKDGSMIAIAHLPPIPATVQLQTELGKIDIDLWDARTGHLLRRIVGDQLVSQIPGTKDFGVLALAFSPDGKVVAVSGAQAYIEFYSTSSGQQVGHLTQTANTSARSRSARTGSCWPPAPPRARSCGACPIPTRCPSSSTPTRRSTGSRPHHSGCRSGSPPTRGS